MKSLAIFANTNYCWGRPKSRNIKMRKLGVGTLAELLRLTIDQGGTHEQPRDFRFDLTRTTSPFDDADSIFSGC